MAHKIMLFIFMPFVKFFAHIYVAFKKPEMNGRAFRSIQNLIRPGDVLLSYTKGEASNFFNRERFTHGALYVGDGIIVESVGTGVREDHLSNFCFKKDHVIVLRFTKKVFIESVISFAIAQKGREYDNDFEDNGKKYYCFELIAAAYKQALPGLELPKQEILDGEFYTCETFLNEFFKVVVDSKEDL